MSKWFEVTVTTFKTFAIELEEDDPELAQEIALDEMLSTGTSEIEECFLVRDTEVASSKRHADEVIPLRKGD